MCQAGSHLTQCGQAFLLTQTILQRTGFGNIAQQQHLSGLVIQRTGQYTHPAAVAQRDFMSVVVLGREADTETGVDVGTKEAVADFSEVALGVTVSVGTKSR